MLVLSRKPGESINIGDGIVVSIVRVQGRRIQIGIEAPRDVPIHRAELITQRENASTMLPGVSESPEGTQPAEGRRQKSNTEIAT